MAGELAVYSRENAKIVLDVVRYLRANGFIVPQASRGQQTFPPAAPIYVRNDSGEAVPPYACMQTTGTVEDGGQNFITIGKPVDATGAAGAYLFNGLQEIAASGEERFGIAHDGPLVRMLKTGALTSGDKATPVVGQWAVAAGGDLITVVGADDIETNVVRGVIGSSGGGSLFRFELTSAFTTGTSVFATIKTMAGSTVGTGIALTDPEAIFLGLPIGAKGYCVLQGGVYYAIQAACAAEEGYL